LVVLLLFDPLRGAIQQAVDRLFYRQAYSYRATVEETSRVLASVLDTKRIAATVLETLTGAMAIEWAVLLVFDAESHGLRIFGRPEQKEEEARRALPPGTPGLDAAGRRDRPLSKYEIPPGAARRSADGIDFSPFERLGAALVVAVRFEAEPVGLVLIGEKRSGAFYDNDD